MTTQAPTAWRNRIVAHGTEAPDQLLANPQNFRIHPKAQQDHLAAVLDQVGFVQDVIVNQRTGHVVDGHLRVELAISRGEESIPVVYVDLDEDEERLVLATFDPISAMAVPDREILSGLLESIEQRNASVQAAIAEIAKMNRVVLSVPQGLTDPDVVPEPPAEPVTKLGDLWILGDHRVLCGDSTKAVSVARLMGASLAGCVFTDPPYGVAYDGGTLVREELVGDEDVGLYEPACAMAASYSDPDAALYLWHAGVKGIAAAAAAAAIAAGYEIRCEIVWNKNQAQYGALSAQYKQKHEPCYYAHKKGKAPRWYGPTNEITVWDVDRSSRNEYHPTQKPVALAVRAFRNSTAPGDVVLDLFLGSGSTLIAAEQLGRRCFGLEIEPKYVDVIVARWEAFTGRKAELASYENEQDTANNGDRTKL